MRMKAFPATRLVMALAVFSSAGLAAARMAEVVNGKFLKKEKTD